MKAKGNARIKHFIITQGTGVCEYGKKKVKLKINDSIMVDKDTPYKIKSTSKEDLEMVKIENKKSSSLKDFDDLVAV
jgi:mannose-6-phosphate isomerase-like protein (cupin superfamily)